MQVSKWGNSLAVRLPTQMVRELGLKEGDEITIVPALAPGVQDSSARVFEAAKAPTREELILGLRKLRGVMPSHFKFDRDEANEMDRFDRHAK